MSKQTETEKAIVEFVSSANSRFTMTVKQIAAELEMLAKRGAAWPPCSAEQWERTIRQALKSGSLVFNDRGYVGPPTTETKYSQMELF